MHSLLFYFKNHFKVHVIGDITWSHAVNSQEKLANALAAEEIMFIESDIRLSSYGVIICAHPPQTESDLTFEELLKKVGESKKGLKLDFKDPEILIPALKQLQKMKLLQPVLLNADVLQANRGNIPKFKPTSFIADCKKYYPKGLISLGWTCVANPDFPYTKENIDQMLAFCKDIDEIIFPVMAPLLPNSWNQILRLTRKNGYTLCVWSNEPLDENLRAWIKNNTDPKKTFYDIIPSYGKG